MSDETRWDFKPDADRARRLMRLLFDPQADEQTPDSDGGEV